MTSTGSPVAWAGNYHLIEHRNDCPISEIKSEMHRIKSTKNATTSASAKLTQLINEKAPGTSLPTHTQRLLCECMEPIDFDKQVCFELMSRDLVIEAYAHLVKMSTVYPIHELLQDINLRLIAINYMTIKQLYTVLNQDAPLTPKAVKANLKYDHPILHLPDISDDFLSDCIYGTPQMGLFGTLFDDLIKGKPVPKNPELNKSDLYTVPWKPALSEADLKVWYRVYRGGIDFRLEGVVNSSIHDIIAITSEVEMAKLWMPSVKVPKMGLSEAKCFARLGRFNKVSLYQVMLPYPLSNVEVVVQGFLTDDLERNNKLTVCMASFDDNASPAERATWPIEIPPIAKGHQRVQFGGGCVFEPRGPDAINMRTVWSVKMADKPNEWLIDFVASKFLKLAFGKFTNTVKQFSDKFAEAQRGDPWLYGHLEKRMEDLKNVGLDPLMDPSQREKMKASQGYANQRQCSVFINEPMDQFVGEFFPMDPIAEQTAAPSTKKKKKSRSKKNN